MRRASKSGAAAGEKASPASHADEYCFDDKGRPRGGLWLPLAALAECFAVSNSCIQAWRKESTWKPRFEGYIGGRLHFNTVQVAWWRMDKARAAGRDIRTVHFELCRDYETRGVFLPAGRPGR